MQLDWVFTCEVSTSADFDLRFSQAPAGNGQGCVRVGEAFGTTATFTLQVALRLHVQPDEQSIN